MSRTLRALCALAIAAAATLGAVASGGPSGGGSPVVATMATPMEPSWGPGSPVDLVEAPTGELSGDAAATRTSA